MKTITVLGAGRSATTLIKTLGSQCHEKNWKVVVADADLGMAKKKAGDQENVEAIQFDIKDLAGTSDLVRKSDLVISMLPAKFHDEVAELCVDHGRHLITASYVSDTMKSLDEEAKKKQLVLLNECGLDPGIDHMSGMRVIDQIRSEGHELYGFETFTGGLLAPTHDDNPWQYKFTWNPRNVVMAGTGGVKFLQEGRFKYIPHHRLFRRIEQIYIPDYGYFEGYANRDSLKYRELYGLHDIKTMFRGTFRRPGFCKAWDVFVQLGATDDTYQMEGVDKMTHRQFINSFLSYNPKDSIELKLAHYLNLDLHSDEMHKLQWSGFFDDELVGLEKGTPAKVLEHILKKKWTLLESDKDMIVMWHKFNFIESGMMREVHSTLVTIGDDAEHTAMSKTVGLPMAIAAGLILENKIKSRGVLIPTLKEIYDPVLESLKTFGFHFNESSVEIETQ